jgi:hypothetical protein
MPIPVVQCISGLMLGRGIGKIISRGIFRSVISSCTHTHSSHAHSLSHLRPHHLLSTAFLSSQPHPVLVSGDVEAAFEEFLGVLSQEKPRESPWRSFSPHISTLPPNSFLQLLQISMQEKNLNSLHLLLSQTHQSSHVAAAIGVQQLAHHYSPFFHDSPDKELSSAFKSLALHFSSWLQLMDKASRPKQILTFFDTIFHQTFRSSLSPFLTLYEEILKEVITRELCETIESEEIGHNILSVLVLTTTQYLSDLNQPDLAAKLLTEAVSEGCLEFFPSVPQVSPPPQATSRRIVLITTFMEASSSELFREI